MCACIEPISVKDFLENPIIEAITRIKLINETNDQNIRAGNRRIEGLNPDKYYLVEILKELEESYDPPRLRFVTATGALGGTLSDNAPDLSAIGRVSDGRVTGLSNDLTYRIWTAAPFTEEMDLYDHTDDDITTAAGLTGGLTSVVKVNAQNILNLPASSNGNYYLDLRSVLTLPDPVDYAVKRPSIDPLGNDIFIGSDLIIKLEEEGTTTEYIFFDGTTPPDKNDPASFWVLTVTIGSKGELSISLITLEIINGVPDFDQTSLTISQNAIISDSIEYILTISNSSYFKTPIKWKYNGIIIAQGETININDIYKDPDISVDFLAVGNNNLSVEVVLIENDKPYSASFTINVTN
ncbi:MAG: hypothetical protein FWB86_01680 [Treponema sp.]|nr:hypothetical protein [Treponema sp.]MCL2250806.1 hypothetical protein [Treponema sp.]